MSAETELLNAYRDWHRLARAEAKAISTRNWDLLADCQLAITDFQTLITRLTIEARGEWEGSGVDCLEKESHIQVFIHELIEITRQNRTMLQHAKDEACAKLEQLGEASRNLKRLKQSYGHGGATRLAT